MTTPQDPGDTPDNPEGQQDPADPQNPYAPPPTTAIPPAPPVFGTGDPAAPAGATPPPYGQPAYAPPPAAQPAYGQPYPQQPAPGNDEPGKGMAITALIASILGCTCIGALVAIPLAIVVLLRSRDGRNHGKGLAIAALIISVVSLVAVAVGGYFLYDYAKDFKNVEDLSAGDCVTAKGLVDDSSESVTEIKAVSCSSKHDGEVLATSKLSAEAAASYGETSPIDICTPPVTAAGSGDLLANPDLLIVALTQDASPSTGDKLVCVVGNADGSKLTSKLGS
jgi:hypothetical protein